MVGNKAEHHPRRFYTAFLRELVLLLCQRGSWSQTGGYRLSSLPFVAKFLLEFVLASPRLLELCRPFLDSKMPSSHTFRRTDSNLCLFAPNFDNSHSTPEPPRQMP